MKPQNPEASARRIASAPNHYRQVAGGAAARFAVVRGGRRVEEIARYLPDNYAVMESWTEVESTAPNASRGTPRLLVVIGGKDHAGWTLDGYVIPRLASGLIFAEEIR